METPQAPDWWRGARVRPEPSNEARGEDLKGGRTSAEEGKKNTRVPTTAAERSTAISATFQQRHATVFIIFVCCLRVSLHF